MRWRRHHPPPPCAPISSAGASGSSPATDARRPTPTLWNREKIGKDVALARELHLAGGAVRKRVTHAPSPSGDAVAVTPGHAWEVWFHVVAYAVRPDAVDAPREEGETGADELDARVPSRARLILSTRADVGGGCGAPHRLILDDRSDGERESSNTAEAAGTTRRERRRPPPPATPRRTPRRLRHPPRRRQTPPSTPDSCASGPRARARVHVHRRAVRGAGPADVRVPPPARPSVSARGGLRG